MSPTVWCWLWCMSGDWGWPIFQLSSEGSQRYSCLTRILQPGGSLRALLSLVCFLNVNLDVDLPFNVVAKCMAWLHNEQPAIWTELNPLGNLLFPTQWACVKLSGSYALLISFIWLIKDIIWHDIFMCLNYAAVSPAVRNATCFSIHVKWQAQCAFLKLK